ncbi:MAG: alpha/beta hydrolase [Roseovarius confluentis]
MILGLAIGAFLEGNSSYYAVISSMVWPTLGPFLFVTAVAACLTGAAVMLSGQRRLGGLTLVLATVATIGAAYILARIGVAAFAAGAMIDLRASFLLEEMSEPAPDIVERVQTVGGTDLRAAVYLPTSRSLPAPVIVYIHGGGFMTGTFTETAADLRWFADKGWLVVSVEYRLFETGNPTWELAPGDVTCAFAWTYRNAGRFGGDPSRIALLGDSAGGNLAINTGFAAAAGTAKSSCGIEIPTPAAIAVLYPAVDPVSIYADGFPIPGFEPKMLIEGYIGGSPEEYPDRAEAIFSTTFLTSDAPPTLVVLPEKDSLVVPSGTLDFVAKAETAGVDIEMVRIPFANHIFNQVAANSLGNQIGRSVRLRFLEHHVR